ncbi:MAG: DUF4145 domain-containing protein [Moorellales bacterium]
MLTIEHRAFFLYREDAYRDYCWSVDAYGFCQPGSFIYLCFEALKDVCAQHGLHLIYRSGQSGEDDFPWRFERDPLPEPWEPRGLILRIVSDEDVSAAVNALAQGRNVIALIPSELLSLFCRGDEARVESARMSAAKLGITTNEWDFRAMGGPQTPVRWVEIPTNNPGRLFVTQDSFLSDGYFMKGHGYSPENEREILSLVRAFACFKTPLLRISHRNVVNSWPTGEPLTIFMDIWNHGPALAGATLTLEIASGFEPLSPLDRDIPPLGSLDRTSFALQVMPRVDGDVSLLVGASASSIDGKDCDVVVSPIRLSIVPGYGSSQRSSIFKDDLTLTRLITAFQKVGLSHEVEALPKLVQVDTRACLNRLRVLTERIVLKVLENSGIVCRDKTLVVMIGELRQRGLVSNRAISYLHTIRIIGNIASHASPEPLSDTDVRIVSFALASIVEELMDRKLL